MAAIWTVDTMYQTNRQTLSRERGEPDRRGAFLIKERAAFETASPNHSASFGEPARYAYLPFKKVLSLEASLF